jgi:predicted flap endonuclease-1-like 5' DNA nuclease
MMERSIRSLVSITLIVAALFVAMNRVAQNAPLVDWWLVPVLLALAFMAYVLEGRGEGAPSEPLVEPGQSSLDGYRQIATPEAHTPAIAPKAQSQAESDHDEIVRAYDEIRDTDVRSDVMASAATIHTAESRSTRGMVKNIMEVGATGTFEEVDEIAGAPVESISKEKSVPRTTHKASRGDDLTIIEGIGPKMSAALAAAGINSFAALSQASEEQINAAIQAAGMRFAPSVPTWAQQAKLAAKADWEGLKKLQSRLKAGRKK